MTTDRKYASFTSGLVTLGALGCLGVALWLAWVLGVLRPPGIAHERTLWALILLAFAAYGAVSLGFAHRPRRAALRWPAALVIPVALGGAFAFVAPLGQRAADGGHFEGYFLLLGAACLAQACAVALHLWTTRGERPRTDGLSARARA